jgi:hypothetical protein
VRRWEAAETNRLNRSQWEKATGQSINADLASDLETLAHPGELGAVAQPDARGRGQHVL